MAIVVPVAINAYQIGSVLMKGPAGQAQAIGALTGYHGGKFELDQLIPTYGPIALGFAVHWMASKFGVNRMLGRAKVPIIRI